MAAHTNNKKFLDFADVTDNLGKIYILILFVSAVIWAFIAVDSFDNANIFKLSLIYSLLLIFGFFGVLFDRVTKKLGIDSRIWESEKLKRQIGIGILFFALWYIVFIRSGLAVATAAVSTAPTFTISPTFNFVLTTILAPLAENIFFFGVINITVITLLRTLLQDKVKSTIIAVLMFATFPFFTNVPNSVYFIGASSALIIITALTQNKFLLKHAPFFASALFIGAVIFPKFHSYAYQLNERNYIAAQYFGFIVCLIAGYIGIMPVDIAHIANNIIAVGG